MWNRKTLLLEEVQIFTESRVGESVEFVINNPRVIGSNPDGGEI